MDQYDINYAREHLDELVGKAARGEEVMIEVPGQGTFRLQQLAEAPADKPQRRRPILGQWKGRLTVPERLFEPLTEEELAWLSGEQSE
jgi:antitoxin (DNA-binding transcriptional repressor) of toxin-antitoxin stability system